MQSQVRFQADLLGWHACQNTYHRVHNWPYTIVASRNRMLASLHSRRSRLAWIRATINLPYILLVSFTLSVFIIVEF